MSAALRNGDGILDLLADAVAQRVIAKIGGHANTPTVYSSHKEGPHLPSKTRRWMVKNLRFMPGSYKVGRDWLIAPEAYEAWKTAEDTRRQAMPRSPTLRRAAGVESTDRDLIASAERSLAADGYRRTK
jgi:hypothetical protein